MFRTTENGLLLTMPPSRNDVISGSTPARICSLKLVAINFCRSGQSNPRFASNLSRFESWTGGNAPGKLDVARAASARPGTSARPEVSLSSDQLRYLKVQNSPCSRSAITDGVLIFTSRGYPKKIRDRDGEIKLMARRKKRRRLVAVAAHCAQPVEQQFKKPFPVKGRLEPARAKEHRQIFLDFPINRRPKATQAEQYPKDRAKEPFAPRPRSLRRTEQAKKVCFIQPQIAQVIDREIMRECARQNNAADAAGRGAGYAVDDDPQTKGPPYRLQERKIDILGIMKSTVIAICGFITLVFSLLRLRDRMICL